MVEAKGMTEWPWNGSVALLHRIFEGGGSNGGEIVLIDVAVIEVWSVVSKLSCDLSPRGVRVMFQPPCHVFLNA